MDAALEAGLETLRAEGLGRRLRRIDSIHATRIEIDGRTLTNFSSNDYLGLARDERIVAAARQALDQFGAGSSASRLVSGSLRVHHELEDRLAALQGTPRALSFASGYATALGAIVALVGRGDVVVIDKKAHACIVDAARLSGATLRVFRHNDADDLERILRWADQSARGGPGKPRRRVLIVTEAIFSMDGDPAPLRGIVELKDRYGAWLMLDEAHAIGLVGPRGGGLANELGLAERIEIRMGTLGKAIGATGGFVTGSAPLIDWLINQSRTFLFSTAPGPAMAGAACAGVEILQSTDGAARRAQVRNLVKSCGKPGLAAPGAILPVIIGDERQTVQLAERMFEAGLFVPAIRFPTVGRGQARLRITLTALHREKELGLLRDALAAAGIDWEAAR